MIYRLVSILILFGGAVALASADGKPGVAQEPVAGNQGTVATAAAQRSAGEAPREAAHSGTPSTQSQAPGTPVSPADALRLLGFAPQPSAARPGMDPALRQSLTQQIAAVRQQLEHAHQHLKSGSTEGQTLDLARQLLDLAQASMLAKPSVVDPFQARQKMSTIINTVQGRIDMLRQQAGNTADSERLLKALDRSQQQLDREKQQLATLSATGGPPPDKEQIRQVYAYAQQRLDSARATAMTLPNSRELLKTLDAAQQRLNKAAAGFDVQPAPLAN